MNDKFLMNGDETEDMLIAHNRLRYAYCSKQAKSLLLQTENWWHPIYLVILLELCIYFSIPFPTTHLRYLLSNISAVESYQHQIGTGLSSPPFSIKSLGTGKHCHYSCCVTVHYYLVWAQVFLADDHIIFINFFWFSFFNCRFHIKLIHCWNFSVVNFTNNEICFDFSFITIWSVNLLS